MHTGKEFDAILPLVEESFGYRCLQFEGARFQPRPSLLGRIGRERPKHQFVLVVVNSNTDVQTGSDLLENPGNCHSDRVLVGKRTFRSLIWGRGSDFQSPGLKVLVVELFPITYPSALQCCAGTAEVVYDSFSNIVVHTGNTTAFQMT